ncbi:MAG TPA: NAD(P)-binding protein [Polyangiaceae bacterium]|jgi:uncharacterized protein with NAD-binding domain and iron-sulfur cluster
MIARSMPPKKRVLILGGGPAGLASAFALTRTEALRAEFEVTVIEPGWRLGGKCRSGRQGPMNRLDQNGTHYLFGAYDNCFGVAREVYDELALQGEQRFGTFQSNFIPRSLLAMKQFFQGQWHDWLVQLPTNCEAPGTGSASLGLSDFLEMGLEWLIELIAGDGALRGLQSIGIFPAGGEQPPEPHPKFCISKLTDYAGVKSLELALSLVRLFKEACDSALLPCIVWILRAFREAARCVLAKCAAEDLLLNRAWTLLELGSTMMIGAIEDDIFSAAGYEAVDRYDLREWLGKHGCSKESRWSAPLATWYNAIAAYHDGQIQQPNMSAAIGFHALLRLTLSYKGAFAYQMRAEVGDSLIAPLFFVLRSRGVRFLFFHRVWDVVPSQDDERIERIEVERQVTLRSGDPFSYQPLIEVNGHLTWPDAPREAQLAESGAYDPALDSFYTPRRGERFFLEHGTDFDHVVLSFPIQCFKWYCSRQLSARKAWRLMFERVETTESQSVRLALKADLPGLGWNFGPAVLSGFYQPLATWEDNGQLIASETWPPDNRPKAIATLFGPAPAHQPYPGPDQFAYPASRQPVVEASGLKFCRDFAGSLWPNAIDIKNPPALDFNLLVTWNDVGVGEERYRAQALRMNVGPAEAYTRIQQGTLRYRLRVDETGYVNLSFAGDWTRNGFDLPTAEAAVLSGLQAARVLTGA